MRSKSRFTQLRVGEACQPHPAHALLMGIRSLAINSKLPPREIVQVQRQRTRPTPKCSSETMRTLPYFSSIFSQPI
jgi:hypothetical protein